MQIAVIEFARNVARLKNANSTEFDAHASNYPVVGLISEWLGDEGTVERRDSNSEFRRHNEAGSTRMCPGEEAL